ncbi:MAG TPA: 3D domain-containing protein [Bacillota bacterium]|nr:3D domain-containing protein [Bacillota bacterium]
MANILEILRNTYILSSTTTEALEQYITNEYPDLTKDDANKVLIQYLQQQIEEHLTLFDPKYQPFIKFRLVHNIITRRPYEITAEDVFKACLHLNVGIESFYRDLTNWLDQNLGGSIAIAELAAYVDQLRRLLMEHPEQPLDELLQTIILPASLVTNPETIAQEKTEVNPEPVADTTRMSPGLFYIDDIVGAASESVEPVNATFPGKHKGVQFAAAAGICLLLLAGSIWGARSYLERISSQPRLARTTVPVVAALPDTSTGDEKLKNHPVNPCRVSRGNPVSRSYIRKTLITNLGDTGRPKPDQSTTELNPENRVIVGYEDVAVNNTTTRIPVIQTFTDKLEMRAFAYGVAKKSSYENGIVDAKNMKNEKSDNLEQNGVSVKTDKPDQNGINPPLANTLGSKPGKFRTVAVDPKVIAPGSRLYIKFAQEYQDLNGIYIAGEPRTENQGKRIDLLFGETTEDNDEVKKSIEAFGSRDVEVYVLK